MQSIREQILQAIMARVGPVAEDNSATLLRAPTTALSRELAPALLLLPESDSIQRRANDRVERHLTLRLVAVVRDTAGEPPEALADRLLIAAHNAIMADQSLGGLSLGIQEVDTDWDIEDADGGAAAMPVRYQVVYRTRVDHLALMS